MATRTRRSTTTSPQKNAAALADKSRSDDTPAADVAGIVASARAVQPRWEALDVRERAQRLRPLARMLADRRNTIADLIEEENGKPRTEAVLHDVVASAQFTAWACGAAPRVLAPERVQPSWFVHRHAEIHRRAFGVVGAIGPWNIPLYIPVSMTLPALLAGNAVVFKPSERTPRIGRLLGQMLGELDLPPGLVHIVEGGPVVGAALVQARPDKLLFTGSAATGRKVMAACAEHPIPCALELGGVDAMIVREDADLELAASAAVWGANFNGGQACCSIERVLVHHSLHDALVARMEDRLRQVDARADLAPAIDERQHAIWLEHIEDARGRGLSILGGGQDIGGHKVRPAMVCGEGVREALCWRDETFGPVVAVSPFGFDEEAVALHNDSPYGLTASIYTRDLAAGRAMALRLRAGAVALNELGAMVYATPELPWGGVGMSGFGRSHGEEGLLDVTWAQVVDEAHLAGFEPRRPWWFPYDRAQADALGRLADAVDAGPARAAAAVVDTGRRVLQLLTRAPRG